MIGQIIGAVGLGLYVIFILFVLIRDLVKNDGLRTIC